MNQYKKDIKKVKRVKELERKIRIRRDVCKTAKWIKGEKRKGKGIEISKRG